MDSFKDDKGKLMYDAVPPSFEEALALVLSFGASKYGKNTWQQVKDGRERYYSALRRHLAAWAMGEHLDSESELPHLYHVAVNALFINYFDQQQLKQKEKKDEKDLEKMKECFRKDYKKATEDFRRFVDKHGDKDDLVRDFLKHIFEEGEEENSPEEEGSVSDKKGGSKFVKIKVADEETAEKIANALEEIFNG